MATTLTWNALELSRHSFRRTFYQYIYYVDLPNQQLVIEDCKTKRIPFYLSFAVLLLILLCCIYLIFGFIRDSHKLPLENVLVYVFLSYFIFAVTAINVIQLLNLKGIGRMMEKIFSYDKKLLGSQIRVDKDGYTFSNHVQVLMAENRKMLTQDDTADVMGIMINNIVNNCIISGLFTAPIGMWFGLDPGYQLLKHLEFSVWKVALQFLRFLLLQWAAMEANRTLSVTLVLVIYIANTYFKSIQKLGHFRSGYNALSLYKQLQIMLQIEYTFVRYVPAVLLLMGLFISVVCNVVLVHCIFYFPPQAYTLFLITACGISMVIHESLPVATNCHIYSKRLIKHKWGNLTSSEFLYGKRKQAVKPSAYIIKHWRKSLRAQKPILFYYGIAMFDEDTKANYYCNIVIYTINVLLLIQRE